jgi:hypothetical protein
MMSANKLRNSGRNQVPHAGQGIWPAARPRALKAARRVRALRLPHVLLLAVCVTALPLLWGCVAVVHTRFPIVIGAGHYHHAPRPHSSYYCYDCHGYTYFDPYYDYCMHFGFRVNWGHHTSLWRYYTRNNDTIRVKIKAPPKYKYTRNYRETVRYKSPVNYQKWKKTDGRTYFTTKQTPTKESKSDSGKSEKSKTSEKSKKYED